MVTTAPSTRVTLALCAALGVTLSHGTARAQSCHAPPPPVERAELGVRLSLTGEVAGYDAGRYDGTYRGLSVAAAYDGPWLRARVALPMYHLRRETLSDRGLGDLFTELRVPIALFEGALVLAPGIGATWPTGDEDAELGMGHAMLVPGVAASWTAGAVFVTGSFAWARMTSSHTAHHADGPSPIVDPMNNSELEGSIAGGVRLSSQLPLRARGGLYGAAPIDAVNGESRLVAFAGLDLVLDHLDVAIEGHVPVAGDPFSAKLVTAIGARF